jgi:phage-related protein
MPKRVYSPKLERRQLFWVGTALDDLRAFPDEVRREIGHALHLAQLGEKSPAAKPLKGFKGGGVLEVVDAFEGEAYRAVYTVRFESGVYALHAFQKKSHRRIATDKRDIDLVEQRLRKAEEIDRFQRTTRR